MKILITGPKCSGKSTIGVRLAGVVGLPFVETDAHIEELYFAETGRRLSCREIFREEGEASFRAREARAAADIAGRDWCVGDRCTVADHYRYMLVGWQHYMPGLEVGGPAVQAHYARVGARLAVARARELDGLAVAESAPRPLSVGLLLAWAYPDRIGLGRKLADDAGRYLLSGGRGAKLRGGFVHAETAYEKRPDARQGA